MKLLSTVAMGALLLGACAPFEHGHYNANVNYQPQVVTDNFNTPYNSGAIVTGNQVFSEPAFSVPATYSTPINIAPPAPIAQTSYIEPVIHQQAPVFIQQPQVIHQQPQVVHQQIIEQPQVIHQQQLPVVHHQHHQQQQIVYNQAPIVQQNYAEPLPYPQHQPIFQQEYQPVAQVNYPAPVQHIEPAQYVETQHHIVEPPHYVEPGNSGYQVTHLPPPPIEYAPPSAPLPIAKPFHHEQYAEAPLPIHQQPVYEQAPPPATYGTSVSVEEQRIEAPLAYAPPQVVNAPPVYLRGAPQYANQPYPAPGYPQFGPPGQFGAPNGFGAPYGAPPAYGPPQLPAAGPAYGYQQPGPAFGGGFGNPYGPQAVPAHTRPYPTAGFNGGYNNPYGPAGCVTSCIGSSSVF